MTLIEEAKKDGSPNRFTKSIFDPEELAELAVSWLRDEISYTQAKNALYGNEKVGGSNVYALLLRGVKIAHTNGKLKVK